MDFYSLLIILDLYQIYRLYYVILNIVLNNKN